ncbi:MAG: hypothetical protein AAGF74_00350 [Pseudomonadota bacterium]
MEGEEFLLIVGADGTAFPEAAYDYVAQYVAVEGEVTRHGDLLIFAMEPETIEVLR